MEGIIQSAHTDLSTVIFFTFSIVDRLSFSSFFPILFFFFGFVSFLTTFVLRFLFYLHARKTKPETTINQ